MFQVKEIRRLPADPHKNVKAPSFNQSKRAFKLNYVKINIYPNKISDSAAKGSIFHLTKD